MSEEELIQHCEKQIMLCEALGDNKHCLEHQLILNIIQQRDLYKSVIDELDYYIHNCCGSIDYNDKFSDVALSGRNIKSILDKAKESE